MIVFIGHLGRDTFGTQFPTPTTIQHPPPWIPRH
ncbi:unnamed protein product [Brassica oleracea var. botrytis]|uniref:Uncharacterized protein n=1 Tax=Brassica oleracea TaxID=3712 RepID=A0A3P6DU93_BRAOL|nr:unnamed protein product [Brassica oleracea]